MTELATLITWAEGRAELMKSLEAALEERMPVELRERFTTQGNETAMLRAVAAQLRTLATMQQMQGNAIRIEETTRADQPGDQNFRTALEVVIESHRGPQTPYVLVTLPGAHESQLIVTSNLAPPTVRKLFADMLKANILRAKP
jgi:hypothetical protein